MPAPRDCSQNEQSLVSQATSTIETLYGISPVQALSGGQGSTVHPEAGAARQRKRQVCSGGYRHDGFATDARMMAMGAS